MSCRPESDIESKREFLANINLGFKSEYEFENGSDCFEFITKELGVNENEDNGPNYIGHEPIESKIPIPTDEVSKKGKCRKTYVNAVNANIKETNITSNKNKVKKDIFNKTLKKIIKKSEMSTSEEETDKIILEGITKAVNFNNIEIIYDSDENEKQLNKKPENIEIVLDGNPNYYQCYICNQNFLSKARRRQHLTSHFKNETKLTTCLFCGKSFTNKNELQKHFTSHLTRVSAQISAKQCKICLKTFSRTANLNRHLNRLHGKENMLSRCNICSRIYNDKTQLQSHMLKTHSKEQELVIQCNICKKLFLKMLLNKHLKSHSANETYKCEVCFKQFRSTLTFQDHYTKHLSDGNKNYKCQVCKKSFWSLFLLKYHIKIKHSLQKQSEDKVSFEISTEDYQAKAKRKKPERKFKCSECWMAFYSNYKLQRHMTVHTGLKNFECSVCLKRFTTIYHLKIHIKRHIAPKEYNCMLCYKVFSTLQHYRRHCKICIH